MIPKKIHYCWFGGKDIPSHLAKYIESWKKHCPDYEIVLWDERTFDIDSHPFTKSAYKNKKFAYVSDYVRAYALNKFGGIYLDTDVELKKNIDLFLEHEAFTGFEKHGLPFTALWASIPDHSLTQRVLDFYEGKIYTTTQEANTASISNMLINHYSIDPSSNVLQVGSDGRNKIHVYPAEYFCLDLLPNYASHHFDGSWLNSEIAYKDFVHAAYHSHSAIILNNKYALKGIASSTSISEAFTLLLYSLYYNLAPNFIKKPISKLIKKID